MSKNLRVSSIQAELFWENPEANCKMFSMLINGITEATDLIILPEMFSTGFTMQPQKVAETMRGKTINWMQTIATTKNVALTGSLVIKENGKYYNRLVFVYPNGQLKYYNKKHTFTLAGEDKVYTAGKEKVIISYKNWQICPLICYDLRFPVWARNTEDYDILIYVANWPKQRIIAWDALLKARAIENMCYCIGVNRVGVDALNYRYSGHSAVYNVFGELVANFQDNAVGVTTVNLSKTHLITLREKLQFLNDKDVFNLK